MSKLFRNTIPVIVGPTAVGKTEYSLRLADQLGAEIISADSMQVYRGMDIGTAKLLPKDQHGIIHHLIDIRNPDDEWTLHHFLEAVKGCLSDPSKKFVVVGGTGLYIQALLYGYETSDIPSSEDVRNRLIAQIEAQGTDDLYAYLVKIDPLTASKIHPHNKVRLIRALEAYEVTGIPFSGLQKRQMEPDSRFDLRILNRDREILYERINQRVDEMLEQGLVEEVSQLQGKGYGAGLPSMQALGYKEILDYLEGKTDLESAVSLIKQRTRNFAKRQLTWYRSFKDASWIDL